MKSSRPPPEIPISQSEVRWTFACTSAIAWTH
jgi:hypothetical protein